MDKTEVLSHERIEMIFNRISWEIFEKHVKEKEVFLAGIDKRGYAFASIIAKKLREISDLKVTLVKVSINKKDPLKSEVKTDIPLSEMEKSCIVVLDDVLNSGHTLIYGVNHFLQIKVKKITTAVLVDRSHKRFPVKADVKGLSLSTSSKEHVSAEIEKKPFSVVIY